MLLPSLLDWLLPPSASGLAQYVLLLLLLLPTLRCDVVCYWRRCQRSYDKVWSLTCVEIPAGRRPRAPSTSRRMKPGICELALYRIKAFMTRDESSPTPSHGVKDHRKSIETFI